MASFRLVLSRLREEVLLLVLLAVLIPLVLVLPEEVDDLPALVDWTTIAALTGLMVLSRGLEESGYVARAGRWMLGRLHTERALAVALVLFAAALSTVITNDVALFIVVPLTVALRGSAAIPVGRLVIFQALAVNAGSALSPVGNPQNILLWQASGWTFAQFILAMAPLAISLVLLLVALVPLGFPARRLDVAAAGTGPARDRVLYLVSLTLYPVFLAATDFGFALPAVAAILALYAVAFRRVFAGVDWLLLVVFVLMFMDLGLLARLPALATLADTLDDMPGGIFTAGVVLSQVVSNVPAAIFLQAFTSDWRLLAWGVSVGGFGVAIGSLANLIALRLAKQPGLWREFHWWSVPVLAAGWVLAMALLSVV